MKIGLQLFFCIFVLLGCEKPSGRWVALKDVPVFTEADEADVLSFTIKTGETCALGKERVVKVFMYREVRCGQRTGWISYSNPYSFRNLD